MSRYDGARIMLFSSIPSSGNNRTIEACFRLTAGVRLG